jgi:hypothetical protein
VLLLNNDTEFLNDVLGILVEFIQEREKVGLVGPLTLYPDGEVQASIKHFPSIWKTILHQTGLTNLLAENEKLYYPYGPFCLSDYDEISEVEWLSGACLMFRRTLFDEIGSLDEGMPFGVEDMDYGQRALGAGFKNYFVPQAKLVHYKGGTLQKRKQSDFVRKSYNQGMKVYFRKHYPLLAYWLIRFALVAGKVPRILLRRGMYTDGSME